MAPNPPSPDSFYLPSLDKCFNDGHKLISWRSAFEVLSDLDLAKQCPNVEHFLQDELSINALASALSPAKEPTAQSKADFESRTAAVAATSTTNDHLNTEQIKSDTLWLSQQTNIDELSALRIVVLEWQDRSASRILSGYPEEELISVARAVGTTQLANLSPNQPSASLDGASNAVFDSDNSRHLRLLCLLLSEHEYLLAVHLILCIAHGLRRPVGPKGRAYGVQVKPPALPWIQKVVDKLHAASQNGSKSSQLDASNSNFVSDGVTSLKAALACWEAGSQWSATLDDPTVFEMAFRTSQLRFVILLLQLIASQTAALDHSPSASAVQQWFEFAASYGFLELLQPQSQDQVVLVAKIHALVSLVSLQMLRLPFTLSYLVDRSNNARPPPITHDAACRTQVDQTLRQAAERLSSIASPAIFAWSIILQALCDSVNPTNEDPLSDEDSFTDAGSPTSPRQASASVPSSLVEARDAILRNNQDGDPVEFYARAAVDGCSVLDVVSVLAQNLRPDCGNPWNQLFELSARICLLELSRQALLLIGYRPEMFQCILEILDCDECLTHPSSLSTDLANVFMSDNEILVPRLLHQAYIRYPYEVSPLLKLSKALVRANVFSPNHAPIAQPLCDPSPSFTQVLPSQFNSYELVREDENSNGVRLTEELPIIINRTWRKMLNLRVTSGHSNNAENSPDQESGEFCIPAGTTGIVISESKPFVVAWDHVHSPLRFLACLLSTVTASSARQDISTDEMLSRESQADIISIFAKLINSDQPGPNSAVTDSTQSIAHLILEEASSLLDRNQDIISVVFELFEQELSQHTQMPEGSLPMILVSCLDFFSAIVKVLPGRLWPLLTRSQLLDMDGKGGTINAIIATEGAAGSCQFLTACLPLLNALRQDTVAQAIPNQNLQQQSSKRFLVEPRATQNLPKKNKSKVVFALARSIADALQGLHTWPLITPQLKTLVTSLTVRVFQDLLTDVYGCDDTRQPANKICGALAPAAKMILESATTFAESGLTTSILLSMSISTLAVPTLPLNPVPSSPIRDCTSRSLALLVTLLDINILQDSQTLHLERHLLRIVPVLVRLFSAHDTYRSSILSLLSSLTRRAASDASKPLSLLGNLGIGNALSFLTQLASLDKPLGRVNQEVKIWELAAAAVSYNQQWVASFLMTGDTPKNSLKHRTCHQTAQKTMLGMALDRLSETSAYHLPPSLAALNFVLQAQNNWPWVTNTIRKHASFVTKLLDYVEGLSTELSRDELEEPNQTYAAALIAEIIATYIHNMRQLSDDSPVKLVVPKLGFFRDNAVALPTYNSSLHTNLKRNFEQKFSGCTLETFKRVLGSSEFGREYCYDVHFAEQVLRHHSGWKGSRDKGFEEELSRANSNLSLVEAQLLLLTGWKSLCVELCQSMAHVDGLQKQMISVANNCLLSNIESNLPESIFENLLQIRADLSLVILQRLISIRCKESGMWRLLSSSWDAVLASGQDFEIAFSGQGASYYRTLLRILFLAIQPHVYLPNQDPENNASDQLGSSTKNRDLTSQPIPILLEVVSKVIGTGFKSLCAQLHEDPSKVAASDFNLLISMLEAVFRVKGINGHFAQMALQLCDTGAHRYAVTLFSWAERLASETNDPIFGEISISFLRELSNIPQLAEFLAAEGILSQLNAAPIMTHLRNDTSIHLQSIWSRGVLPLALNILVSVGDSFAPEANAFLNSFPTQLKRASSSLSSSATPSRANPLAGAITLPSAAELHTLAMISVALDKYRDSPAANAAAAAGYGTELEWDRAGVKEDLEAWLQSSRAQLKAKIAPTCPREAQVQLAKPVGAAHGGEDGCENRLEESVVKELKGALSYLDTSN